MSRVLLTIVGQAMLGLAMPMSFTPLGTLVWLAVVASLSIFASLLPARQAARLTINEVLAYERRALQNPRILRGYPTRPALFCSATFRSNAQMVGLALAGVIRLPPPSPGLPAA